MIGIVIIGHDTLSECFLDTVTHIIGSQHATRAVRIDSDRDPTEMRKEIETAICDVDQNDGVIIVTDLHGSSPYKLVKPLAEQSGAPLIHGANVALLVTLMKSRHMPLNDAVERAVQAGRKYIGVTLKTKPDDNPSANDSREI